MRARAAGLPSGSCPDREWGRRSAMPAYGENDLNGAVFRSRRRDVHNKRKEARQEGWHRTCRAPELAALRGCRERRNLQSKRLNG
jgi:hypothetical protein